MRRRQTAKRSKRIARAILILVLLIAVIVLAILVVMRSCGNVTQGEPGTTEKPGIFDNLFGSTPEPTLEPTPEPTPTPTPIPEFAPAAVESTQPEAFGMECAVEIDGQRVENYQSTDIIDILYGDKYTELEGVITFRGNNFRDSASYGMANLVEKKIGTEPWTFTVGSLAKVYNSGAGGGSWTGCGWTGQPLIVKWPEATKKIMNLNEAAKNKPDLVEVIYATMDGHIYFLDLETGAETRPSINTGFPFKGAGALDPRGYPIMYVGSGDDSPELGKGSSHAFIISLIDGSVLYEFGAKDSFSLRNLSYFDSSPLVDAESDTLIYPGESGILYLIKLNTQYDETAGTLSISPKVVKWRYKGARNDTTAYDGSSGWWLGVEDSAIIWRGHAIFSDNGGHLMCLDLNTLRLVWVQDTLDDTNCTPVLSLEGEDEHPSVYTSTSFHTGWRKSGDSTADIPVWKIDAVTGEIVWSQHYNCETMTGVSGGVQGTLAMGKNALSDYIFVPVAMTDGGSGKLVALRKSDGGEQWTCNFAGYPWSSPVAIYDASGNGYLIQCNKTGYIHLIDGQTGVILDEMSLGSNIEASPAIYNNIVVVGTRGGLIYGVTLK